MSAWSIANIVMIAIISFLMLYQIIYILFGLVAKKKYKPAKVQHSYGVLIAGRNEEKVIGHLLDSLNKQNYPQDKLKIFVCADNCSDTDKSAEICRQMGAVCYERKDLTKIGKSYALDFLFHNIVKDFPDYKPDGFFMFDADNLLDLNYIEEMNKAFDSGEKIVTSYRASKNYGDSLMSMGSSVHFIRECRFMHTPRALCNISTHVSGTGFLFSSEILNAKMGWKYGSLTEDLEFSCDNLIKGHKVAYCDDAIFYDEQPTTLKQTYHQRLRWQKGLYQCFGAFAFNMFFKMFSRLNFAFFDFFVFFLPLPFFSTSWAIMNGAIAIIRSCVAILNGAMFFSVLASLSLSLLIYFLALYGGLFLYGSLAVLKDWKRIKTTKTKKVLSMFAYPVFMITLIPICFIAVFKKVEWKPIEHTKIRKIDEIDEIKIGKTVVK